MSSHRLLGMARYFAPPPGVIPAKAGTQLSAGAGGEMGPSFRWDDIEYVGQSIRSLSRR